MLLSSHTVWVWTLLNYPKLWWNVERKEELKNSIWTGLFITVAPLWPSWSPLSLCLHSLISPLPPISPTLFMDQEGRWVIDGNSADLWFLHTHTHTQEREKERVSPFPPQAPSLFLSLSYGSHMNNVVLKPEWGQESNGETYSAVRAVYKWPINNQRPGIRRDNTVFVFMCTCFIEGRLFYLVNLSINSHFSIHELKKMWKDVISVAERNWFWKVKATKRRIL